MHWTLDDVHDLDADVYVVLIEELNKQGEAAAAAARRRE